MKNITLIAKEQSDERIINFLDRATTEIQFIHGEQLAANQEELGELAVIVPWPGFRELIDQSTALQTLLQQRAVLVLGPYEFFGDVEDFVIQGAVTYVTTPNSSALVSTVINELLAGQCQRPPVQEGGMAASYSRAS